MRNATEIIIVLDKSGSMEQLKHDAIGGFNSFLREQQLEPGEATLTLIQFDTNYIASAPLAVGRVPALTERTYQPGGATALLDALGRTIRDTGARLATLSEADRPDKVIVVTITDGEENSSREFSLAQVRDAITHQQQRYAWKFLFLGANQDAFAEARNLGMDDAFVSPFAADSAGIGAAYRFSSKAVREYRKLGKISPEWKKDVN